MPIGLTTLNSLRARIAALNLELDHAEAELRKLENPSPAGPNQPASPPNGQAITPPSIPPEQYHKLSASLDLALSASGMATFEWNVTTGQRNWSDGVHRLLGTHAATFRGTSEELYRVIHPDDLPTLQAALTRTAETRCDFDCEYRVVWPDGSIRHICSRGKIHTDSADHSLRMVGVCWDITARKRDDQELRRINRTLRALNQSNRAMLLAHSEGELLNQVCQIIAHDCGYPLVWVGYAENDHARSIRPVAFSASTANNLMPECPFTWSDDGTGCSTTGKAIRLGRPVQCADMLTDPDYAHCRAIALEHGYASSLALPLLDDGNAFGTVTLYSRQSGGFPDRELELLSGLASDLARGIITFRLREARNRAEAAMRASEARFRGIFHSAATPTALLSARGHLLEINQAFCKLLGRAQDDLLKQTWDEVAHPDERSDMRQIVSHLLNGKLSESRKERRYLHHDGRAIWCDSNISMIPHADGTPAYLIFQAHDISARKDAEEALRASERYAHSQWGEAEATLEAIPANIALLDAEGVIVRINRAWAEFALHNGGQFGQIGVGCNYLAVCDASAAAGDPEAALFAEGIRAVFSRQRTRFAMEYACHSPKSQCWYIGHVTASHGAQTRAVVAHVDLTQQKLIEAEIRVLNHELEQRVARRTDELQRSVAALKNEINKRHVLEREILEISEREQSRLGQDLHDGVGQELAGTAMLGDVLAKKLKAENSTMAEAAAKVVSYILSAIESTRRLAKGLYPIELHRYGLSYSLKDLAEQTQRRSGISCELHADESALEVQSFAQIHIYRMIQECVTNAIKHGQPPHILIECSYKDDTHIFEVTDDGQGFNCPKDASGMGLHLMDYRARLIGASVAICRPKAGGCQVTIRLPHSEASTQTPENPL